MTRRDGGDAAALARQLTGTIPAITFVTVGER